MKTVLLAIACATLAAGPAMAQAARMPTAPAKADVKREAPKPDYWVSRDLGNVLTKVVTLRLH